MVNTKIRLILFFAAKDGEALYSQQNKTRSWLWLRSWNPFCQIQLKLKKVGKTTRPFRYDLNQIPYDYTVEVRNRFKGLDLINRVPDELWNEVCDIVQETGIKTIPMEKQEAERQEFPPSQVVTWAGLPLWVSDLLLGDHWPLNQYS